MSGTIILDQPQQIAYARMLTLAMGLAFEIKCAPMKYTRFALIPIAKDYGFKGSRKPAALAFMIEKLKEVNPDFEPTQTMQDALAK